MATAQPSTSSCAAPEANPARPLPLRMRADLIVRHATYQGAVNWVVKDPLALQYFRLRENEYAVLRWLDGTCSLEELKRRYDRQFAPTTIEINDLLQFIGLLHRRGLLIGDTAGQGTALLGRKREEQRQQLWARFTNVFAIRFRGVDPDRFLNAVYPWMRWLFTRWATAAWALLALAALVLVTVEFQVFRARLPEFHQFFSLGNSLWLLVAVAAVKVVHELGHALTCKHFGGECHEIGLMLLVFTPCLYCNVSDSWLVGSRWKRAMIGAAGMYVEVLIASVCTFLWWFSQPGLLNHLCLNLMFVCSVSTLVFNSNPLLRFDGYYIVSDLLEIPNLRQKATQLLKRVLCRHLLGMQLPEDPMLPQRHVGLFTAFAVASFVYRWLVVVSIAFLLKSALEPYGLQAIGHLLIGMLLVSAVVVPSVRLVKFVRTPERRQQMQRTNLLATAAGALVVLVIVSLVPLPHRVRCAFTVIPHQAEPVYVHTPGALSAVHVEVGRPVQRGQLLATLTNRPLLQEILALEAALTQQRLKLDNLLRQRFLEQNVLLIEHELRESITALEEQWRTKQADLQALEIKAPQAGMVIPAAAATGAARGHGLPTWSGNIFDKHNQQVYLATGTLLCYVGEGTSWELVLEIDPADVEFVSEGQQVAIQFHQQPGNTWEGTVALVAHGEQAHYARDEKGSTQRDTIQKTYFAKVVLEDGERWLRPGLTGQAKIYTAPQTLLSRALRWYHQNFK